MNTVTALTITRNVVELGITDPIEPYFHQLTIKGISSFQSTVLIFDGYNDTIDEVYEILEIRDWVYSLFLLFPHFFISLALNSIII